MDNPAAWHLMEMVRKVNDIGQRARSGAPGVDDYLQTLASDPTTDWFTEILREKSAELERERQRTDQLACALRVWYRSKQAGASDLSASQAESQLVNALQVMGIIEP